MGDHPLRQHILCRAAGAACWLLAALLATHHAASQESLWIEAEHLDGMRGYCWPMGDPEMKKTAGHWGLSGPGWAAEWNQGGESGFLSIATAADDDRAVATKTDRDSRRRQLPRLGPLRRLARNRPSGSRSRSSSRARPSGPVLWRAAGRRRRQRDEALLGLGLRLGLAHGGLGEGAGHVEAAQPRPRNRSRGRST